MIKKCFQWFKHKSLEFKAPLLAGVLVGTCYIPFPPWSLLFCYVPLWLFLVKPDLSLKKAFVAGWLVQFVLTLIGFHWITYTAHEFGSLPWVVAILTMLIFAALAHLYIAFSSLIAVALKRKFKLSVVPSLFVIALCQSLAERIWPSIFPWHLGYTLLWAKLPIYQLADLVGFEGLSTGILLFNAWFAYIWISQHQMKKALTHIVLLFGLFAGLIFWGQAHKREWDQTDAVLKVNIIQANIGNLEKVYAEQGRGYQADITNKFLDLSKKSLAQFPDADLLMWPETAFPDYLDGSFLNRRNQTLLTTGLTQLQKPLLTGAYSKDAQTDIRDDHATYNALFLVSPQSISYSPPARKVYLLAFGEYLPFSEQFPYLLKLLPFVSNFGRGKGPTVLTMPTPGEPSEKVRIGGQVCYEGLYADFSRDLSSNGAQILANVTNDSWFGYPFEPNQHLYMTLARGVETRRPLIRSTNTGISTAIAANGDVQAHSPLHQEWFGQFVVPYKKNPALTFYVRYGHWDWVVILFALLILVLTGAWYARSSRP